MIDDWVYYQTICLFHDIPLLYYYINVSSSIIYCLSSRAIYISFGISINFSSVCGKVSELFCGEYFKYNFITNKITSCFCGFLNYSFDLVLSASAADFLGWSKSFWLYFPLTFLSIFLPMFLIKEYNPIFFHKYSISRFNSTTCHFLCTAH